MLKTIFVMAFVIIGFANVAYAQQIISGEPKGVNQAHDKSDKVIVLFYAEWCPSCRVMFPRLLSAVENLENKQDLTIIQFDFTNELTQVESAGLAGEHGLSDLYNEYSPSTGFAVLVNDDVEIHEQIRLTDGDSAAEMNEKIKDYIKTKS